MAKSASDSPRPKVVILGGGFGGIYAAHALKKKPVDVLLLDRRNHHLFAPLLYQVATAALNPSDIAYPIRSIFNKQRNVEVILAEARAIDTQNKKVELTDGSVDFDYLVVATGSTHSYFGHDEWAPFSPGLKTVEDALEVRRRVLLAFEAAERENDPELRKEWLTFVLVGGGPTGVEMAGALAEISKQILKSDFRHLGPGLTRVMLVEAGPRILSAFPESLSSKAQRDLEQLGVEVKCGQAVTGIDDRGFQLGDQRIAARTVLWTAGVAASPLAKTLNVPLDRAGRVKVEPDLSIPGSPNIFVVGDLAATTFGPENKPVPGVAQGAIQGGTHAAHMILRRIEGKPTEPFKYWDKGNMATIGRARAIADLGKLRLSGFIAWLAWLLIHITYLIGFRNRVLVLTEWAWTYLTFERGARLITGPVAPLANRRALGPATEKPHLEPTKEGDGKAKVEVEIDGNRPKAPSQTPPLG
jgi:NADH dehydrogenase